MAKNLEELSDLIEISDQLSSDNVQKLTPLLEIPAAFADKVTDGTTLLSTLQDWGEHDPSLFYDGMKAIGRYDLLEIAQKYPWLASGSSIEREKEISVQSLISVLQNELTDKDWHRIKLLSPTINVSLPFDAKLELLLQNQYITTDLTPLAKLLSTIKREDVANIVQKHQQFFTENPSLVSDFAKHLYVVEKYIAKWNVSLMKYLELQNKEVQQMLDDEEKVDLESVFVPLTIIKEKPRLVNAEDETTYNEIEFMRKIASKQIDFTPVDFDHELHEYFPSNPEIWCLIGNPGCGKTFLCHRIGLLFGQNKLPQFSFAVSIPCRNAEWHQMEQSKKVSVGINTEFIQNWLCLSMPVDASWRSDLAKHLVESDGEGLLIIIDSLDEYTKEVPFEQTLLFLLLTRKVLRSSTILVTSRPGAYTNISSNFQLSIDRFYQVLGFSPENRDLYFRIQLPEQEKLDQLKYLIHLHDDINQLSLVPVNASLFAALVRENDNVSAFTLTLLYTELISYLIRRQLSRMNLKHLAKKQLFPQMHPDVVDCLHRVGEVAYLGVSSRELTSTKDILLKVDGVDQACQCLGLAEEHIKMLPHGKVVRVWCFSHLTIQEFVGANWLRNCSWRDQCLSTRYIVNSDDNFSVFKMVVRFVCGLLSDNADLILSILYKFLPTKTVDMIQMPMVWQLHYKQEPLYSFRSNCQFLEYSGCKELTRDFLVLSEMLFECDSKSVLKSFIKFRRFLPESLYFYFVDSISPNEWKCFLKSLRLLPSIQLIYFDTCYVSPSQFKSLLEHLHTCSLSYLAVKLDFSHFPFFHRDFSTLSSYSEVLEEIQLPPETKLSLKLQGGELTDSDSAVSVSNLQILKLSTSLYFHYTEFPHKFLKQIGNQLKSIDNLYFYPRDSNEYQTLIPLLKSEQERPKKFFRKIKLWSSHTSSILPAETQLTGIHLYQIEGYEQELRTQFPLLSNLLELALKGGDTYSLLPHLCNLSRLTYLRLDPSSAPEVTVHEDLLRLLNTNKHTLRGLELSNLDKVGPIRWDEFFRTISICINLVRIRLSHTTLLQHDDVTLLGTAVSRLISLVDLELDRVRLDEIVLLHMYRGLIYHPTIQYLGLRYCKLNSNYCDPLTHLIPTLLQLKTLNLYHNNLYKPNPEPFQLLEQTAKLYSITLEVTIQDEYERF